MIKTYVNVLLTVMNLEHNSIWAILGTRNDGQKVYQIYNYEKFLKDL